MVGTGSFGKGNGGPEPDSEGPSLQDLSWSYRCSSSTKTLSHGHQQWAAASTHFFPEAT